MSVPSFSQSLKFDDIKKIIEINQTKSIEELLPLLPEEFRARSTYVYKSESLQEASPENPRVIMFGRDASLMMSFNGHASQKRGHNLELIQFDDKTKEYALYEIAFDSQKKSAPVISEKNPGKCIVCHGEKPKPIWEAYPLWPGVIGAEFDTPNESETKYMKAFLSEKTHHGRYKHIPKPALVLTTGIDVFETTGVSEEDIEINTELNILLNRQNLQTIAKELKNNPVSYDLRYAILGSMTCPSEQLDEFIPKDLKSKMKSSKDVVKKSLEASLERYFSKTIHKQKKISGEELKNRIFTDRKRGDDVSDDFMSLQWLLKNFNYSTKNWPLTLEKGTDAYTDGIGGINRLDYFLWRELLDKNDDKTEYEIYLNEYEANKKEPSDKDNQFNFSEEKVKSLCESLKNKSLNALEKSKDKLLGIADAAAVCMPELPTSTLEGIKLAEDVTKIANKTNPMESCIGCHQDYGSEDGIASSFKAQYPRGSFIQEVEYRLKNHGRDRMPRNKVISVEEQDFILKYLSDFSRK